MYTTYANLVNCIGLKCDINRHISEESVYVVDISSHKYSFLAYAIRNDVNQFAMSFFCNYVNPSKKFTLWMSKNVYRRVQEIANIKIYQASSYEFIESPKLFNFDQPALNTTLNLNSLYLKSLPPNFVSFNFVTRLSLQNNLLTTIPAELTSLKALEILDCSFNFLKDIPGWLSSLVNLKIIDLSFNHIRSVDLLVKCPKLEEADLMCNMIKSIPEGLLKLKNIDLSLNPISADLLIRLNDEATNFGKVFEFSYAIDFLDSESDQVLDSKLWDSLFDSLR